MEHSLKCRPISSGSSDPIDIFLEKHSLYRKQMPKDGTDLFRLVAEQMYDTQTIHYEIRKECVNYMTLKRRRFEKYVQEDYNIYTRRMLRPKTRGTLLELRAMCFLYRRNVHFYEPYKLMQSVTFDKNYTNYFNVFYTNEEFDSIYTMDYYEMAAVAQSIAYKLIYKQLFKLPDLSLAVEQILYGGSFMLQQDKSLINCNGRNFVLDKAQDTKCLLTNSQLCCFHYDGSCEVSCVRQLLNNCCLPFSYKVAKFMDPLIYSNQAMDIYYKDQSQTKFLKTYHKFRVGVKCRVELEAREYTGYIQKINQKSKNCIVYIQSMGEKLQVSLSQVHSLPPRSLSNRQKLLKNRYISAYTDTQSSPRNSGQTLSYSNLPLNS